MTDQNIGPAARISSDFLCQIVILANLVVHKHLKVLLEQSSQLQQRFLVGLLICPLHYEMEFQKVIYIFRRSIAKTSARKQLEKRSRKSLLTVFIGSRISEGTPSTSVQTPLCFYNLPSEGCRNVWHR